jgi:ABC-2 type transport system ATP-binding protein
VANPYAIDTRRLTRRFDDIVAVDGVELRVASGAIFGLLGGNGAGKTTMVKMLTTLLAPTSGSATVAGFDIVSAPHEVRRRIGYVPQMLSADGALTGYENLLLSARLYAVPRAELATRIADALGFMGLNEARNRLVKTYSGGMVRRLELAQSMLHRPAVLFLDEPTIGLDPVARHLVWQRLRDLNARFGMTILLTTHDMEEADHLCGDLAILHAGKLAAHGSPTTLKAALSSRATLDDVFAHYSGTMDQSGRLRDTDQTRRAAQRLE